MGTRGTLCQLKAAFNHRTLSKEVKNNVQQVWDMMQVSCMNNDVWNKHVV